MAEGIQYICNNCAHNIEAWSDGNPYYINKKGCKEYAYHPDSKLDKCIGNDSPHICLTCGEAFSIDSRNPATRCHKCDSTNIADTYRLDGVTCPYCHAGTFERDHDYNCIS